MRSETGRLCEDGMHADVRKILSELRGTLEDFDRCWTAFEKVPTGPNRSFTFSS